jgi:Kef-type K+ transport system membrane component KefB
MSPVLPHAAATEVAGVLTDLFLVLLAAKLGDELFKRLHQPAVVGEVLGGLAVGPSVLGLVGPTETLEVFAELGVVFLLFWVGLEVRLSEMREVGGSAALAGGLGVVIPFTAGFGLGVALGESTATSMFIGAAMVATSVGITSAVMLELGVLRTRAGRTILGAAVVDDILALLLLAVATAIAAGGEVDLVELGVVIALSLGFVAFFALGGTALTRARPRLLGAPRFSESPLLPAVLICFGLAALAAEIGLATIIGAFLAGMIVAETKEQHPVEDEVAPLYAFLTPFFFAFIGINLDLDALLDPESLLLLAAVTTVAVVTKFGGAWLGARGLGGSNATFVGVGMVPRGEVGIVVAAIGQATGVVDEQLFAVIVGMSILTALLAPPVLRRLAGTLAERSRPHQEAQAGAG